MNLLIEDAARLWKSIPAENLHGAMEAAIIEAGSFVATGGLVAKLWASGARKEAIADHAALGPRQREDEKRFLSAPDARPPTDAEKEANAKMFSDLAKRFSA